MKLNDNSALARREIRAIILPALFGDSELADFLAFRACRLGIPIDQLRGKDMAALISTILMPSYCGFSSKLRILDVLWRYKSYSNCYLTLASSGSKGNVPVKTITLETILNEVYQALIYNDCSDPISPDPTLQALS